jgi:heme/copper-type cytochrome/quinol oxidase subunit 2
VAKACGRIVGPLLAREAAMKQFLSALSLFLLSCWAFAATKEMEGANAPVETVDTVWVVVFVVLFVVSIIGFFIYLFMTDKKKSDQ